MTKTFLLFSGEAYYPKGPDDLVGLFNSIESAVEHARKLDDDWFSVLNASTGAWEVVYGPWFGQASFWRSDGHDGAHYDKRTSSESSPKQ